MHLRELEEIADREFRRLPLPRAPETLLPRVMAAVQAWARRPWYARAWLTWPLGLQAASAAVFALLATAGWELWPMVNGAAIEVFSGAAAEVASRANVPIGVAEMAMQTARVLWHALFAPLVQYVFAVVVLMSAACATFGTAIKRMAFDGEAI